MTRNSAKTAQAVIGAGYGDEGKGLATDWLCAEHGRRTIAVRFNGSAQAGHTVVTPKGKRHVFHHVSSGTLAGAETHLGPLFSCHPMVFFEEMDALEALGAKPIVSIDPRAMVTTPYDVMINQAIERARGSARHGSCGMGFGETVERHTSAQHRIEARMLGDRTEMAGTLRKIRDEYVPQRLAKLGLEKLDATLRSEKILERFVDDTTQMSKCTKRATLAKTAGAHRKIVFEGAQGLLLDMDAKGFPHVTRSKTGLDYIAQIANEAKIERIDVTYVTRWYATRHGAGPLAHEMTQEEKGEIEDRTNTENTWQGTMRFGWLDIDMISEAVASNEKKHEELIGTKTSLVTCIDQMVEQTRYVHGGNTKGMNAQTITKIVAQALGCERRFASHGPTRMDVLERRITER